ncbi:DNA gyrase inhibitor YacG [Deefgea rivuli]|uniref:DNA gyrase inhibitor YacG n=1 Tax=Deefgea rivuli TaxID=400948 RepID=UPI0027E3F928|nr:DNA gyrase inhibitor YacG [Deefgea rivuli]
MPTFHSHLPIAICKLSMKKIACPQCGTLIEYSTSNPFRPFCSERCKMLDLGAWASESYRLPDNSTSPESLDDSLHSHTTDTN